MDNPSFYDPVIMGDNIEIANSNYNNSDNNSDNNSNNNNNNNNNNENIKNDGIGDEFMKKLLEKGNALSLNHGWNSRNEIFIISIQLNCNMYRKMHDTSAVFYSDMHKFMTFILIISSSLLTVLTSYPDECRNFSIIMVRFAFTYIVTVFSVLMNFLNYARLSERHRVAACEFLKLHHNIQQQMCLYKRDRLIAFKYLSSILKKYDHIILSSPLIIRYISNKFQTDNTLDENINNIIKKIPLVPMPTSDVHTDSSGGDNKLTSLQIDNHLNNNNNLNNNLNNLDNNKEPFIISGDIYDEDVKKCNSAQIKELRLKFFKENSTYEYLRFLHNESE